MKKLLIVGAGQLGSRHLQGLVKLPGGNKIYIIDPSEDALGNAHIRANEIQHSHDIYFFQNWSELPNSFDLAIVATNSIIRERITRQLLESFHVTFLILEKVLFPNLTAYHQIAELLEKNQTPCWVNHPRRMFEHYQQAKQNLLPNVPTTFQAVGGNWGLGCNGLHLLDIFSYLDGSKLLSINTDFLDDVIHTSKREGYIEFTGTIFGEFSSGSTFQITSWVGTPSPITVTIFQSNTRYVIQESGTPQVIRLCHDSNYKSEIQEFTALYQSTLTTNLAAQLFETMKCDLPRFDESRLIHEKFIAALLSKYNQLTNRENTICPIT